MSSLNETSTDHLRNKVMVRGGGSSTLPASHPFIQQASGQIFTEDVNGFFREGGWPETLQFDVSYDNTYVKSVKKIPMAVGPWLKTVNRIGICGRPALSTYSLAC